MRDCLTLVLARSPEEERRIKSLGGRGEAAEHLHRVLLERTLQAAGEGGADVRWVIEGDRARARALGERFIAPSRLQLATQVGDGLGERLTRAFADAFADGYRRVVVIGGDTPGLRGADLAAAFSSLRGDGRRAVLGPAADGGFYLLGLSAPAGELLCGVALCTRKAASDTLTALAATGFSLQLLRPLADIDDRRDLVFYRRRLRAVTSSDRRLLAAADAVLSSARPRAPAVRWLRAGGVRRTNPARAPPLAA